MLDSEGKSENIERFTGAALEAVYTKTDSGCLDKILLEDKK